MSDTVIATYARITIGSLTVDAYMLPDGGYRMSQTQTAEAIGLAEVSARRFLGSKAIKGLLGKGYTPDTLAVEKGDSKRGGRRINALPLEVVSAFWLQQCIKGNKKAIALTMALLTESLERRFDSAFGVERSEEAYNTLLFNRVESLETDVDAAYAVADDMARENQELWFYIRANNLPGPYQIEEG